MNWRGDRGEPLQRDNDRPCTYNRGRRLSGSTRLRQPLHNLLERPKPSFVGTAFDRQLIHAGNNPRGQQSTQAGC